MTTTLAAGTDWIRVGTLAELQKKGCIVVKGSEHPLAVFYHEGKVRAVDNRCPHLGFPLSRGSVADGILTCHWHHARFDLASGCTFDLWADDVPTSAVEIRDGEVFVAAKCGTSGAGPARARAEYLNRRLREGMAQDIGLIIAKTVIALLKQGVDYRRIVRSGILFGAEMRDAWSPGATILMTMANIFPQFGEEERYLGLYAGLTRVADDCAGQVPHRQRYPLEGTDATIEQLRGWLRQWAKARHRDAAERTLITAIHGGATPGELAEMLLITVSDRAYADGGHALDFINKACESLDLIGWEHADRVLAAIVPHLVNSRGGEESNPWHQPIDLIGMLHEAFAQLPGWVKRGGAKKWNGESRLADDLRSENPQTVVDALAEALRAGARPSQLSKSLAYAAAMRIARFGTANEFSDWITALHTLTYCNGVHQLIKRIETEKGKVAPEALRAIFQGAISVYLDRFLNVPPAALPGERDSVDDEPSDPEELLEKFLDALDMQQRVNVAARVVSRYLQLGHPVGRLIEALARGVLREDANFHTYQALEACVQQYEEWGDTAEGSEGKNILIALARYLAAHSPTQRSSLQTAEIALKLDRGKVLHEEE
jgi:nitrite reductase/ring-hydroxylating ferredoxin subunit